MRKKFLLGFLCLLSAALFAEVSVISVTDEAKHATKDDFSHTLEYFISPLKAKAGIGGKCQATRIGKRWFVTAAHCVTDLCKNSCQIQMDLLEGPVSAFVSVEHTPKKPAVFIHPDFIYNVFVKNDLALIRLDVDNAKYTYYRRGENGKPRVRITKKQFNEFLAKNPKARSNLAHVEHPEFPPLLVFDDGNWTLKRKISVVSIFDGVRAVKANPNPVYYVNKLGFAYTKNFGIRRGMSGSGVMSNTGEFLGIISGVFQVSKMTSPTDKNPNVEEEFFMFLAFNRAAMQFMESVMGSDFYKLDIKDAYPNYVIKSRQSHAKIIERLNAFYKRNAPAQEKKAKPVS